MHHTLAVFQDKKIRKVWYKNEWWFSIIDIVAVLTESERPRKYWADLKSKLISEGFELSDFFGQLKLPSTDGKFYETDCTNTEGAFRIIQSIPSPKAEPFKLWLAKTGYERVQEIENPELAQNRVKTYYEMKGYPKDWIDKRLRGIAIRQELTGEWKNRGVQEEKEFAILTNEISKATFGKTIEEYKELKNLKKENLRDHMTDWEIILTMVGEKATTDITIAKDDQGFIECQESAKEGGTIANLTKTALEKKTGKNIVSKDNHLNLNKRKKIN